MGPADASGGSATWEFWPAKNRAEVAFLLGERAAAERLARRYSIVRWIRATTPGWRAPPMRPPWKWARSRGRLSSRSRDPLAAAYRAYYYLRRVGRRLVLVNDGFHLSAQRLRGRGLGLHVFHRQVQNAAALGVAHVEAVAGRRADENGYYTWPRFGFDGLLPAQNRPAPAAGPEGRTDGAGPDGRPTGPPQAAAARRHAPRRLRPQRR